MTGPIELRRDMGAYPAVIPRMPIGVLFKVVLLGK